MSLQSQILADDQKALASLVPVTIFAEEQGVPIGTAERVEILLEQTIDASTFLHTFLGFQGPRIHLILGQNQNEIRATGGFIGVAVELTLDEG